MVTVCPYKLGHRSQREEHVGTQKGHVRTQRNDPLPAQRGGCLSPLALLQQNARDQMIPSSLECWEVEDQEAGRVRVW